MVKSKINDTIDYIESKKIEKEDFDLECTSIYTIEFSELDNESYDVVFGSRNNKYINKGIVYFPMYIVIDSNVKHQIGCNEIELSDLPNAIDDDGDIEPDYINPLLYKHVTKMYLDELHGKNHQNKNIDAKVDENDDNGEKLDEKSQSTNDTEKKDIMETIDLGVISLDDESDDDGDVFSVPEQKNKHIKEKVFDVDLNHKMPQSLPEETRIEAKEIRDKFTAASQDNWVQKFMKNKNYDIIDNEGNGDCFFAVVRDAYEQIGKKITIEKLRSMVSEEMTEPIYKENYKVYLEIESSIDDIKNDIKKHTGYKNEIKKKIDNSVNLSRIQREELVNEANISVNSIKQARKDLLLQEQIMKEFSYMQKLDTLDKYREYMMSSSYWANAWVISTLENKLNVKFIIMSQEAYIDDAEDSVMQCGDFNSNIQEKGSFSPEWYILTTYNGEHYELISYKKKRILEFKEIPYDIKNLILNKCLEKNAGPYNLIEDFRNLKKKVNSIEDSSDSSDPINSDLYESDIVFMFHSKSQRSSKPGKGSGEKIPSSKILHFKPLEKCNDWRRKLDDCYLTSFTIDNHKWATVEHYYQGSKFKNGFPDYYLQFSLDSNTDTSKDVALAKKKGTRKGQDNKVKIDPDFYGERCVSERVLAVSEKFKQNPELKECLLKTYPAKLMKFSRGTSPKADIELMQIRKQLMT